jgi:hypothetical protein
MVPYAETLIKVLESGSTASRRDPDKLCDLISLIAYLCRFQKPQELRDEAELVDLYVALQLGMMTSQKLSHACILKFTHAQGGKCFR